MDKFDSWRILQEISATYASRQTRIDSLLGVDMRIAARMAMQEQPALWFKQSEALKAFASASHKVGYHGHDVVIHELSPTGFAAASAVRVPKGSVVRLRVPGAGMMIAKIVSSKTGALRGEFINPVSPSRLRMTLGIVESMLEPVAA